MSQKYTDYSQLPLSLSADEVAQVLSISRAKAYSLMHSKNLPTIFIGKRMIVPKEQFLAWMAARSAE